jgi:TorA maturation chaperone TorD
MEPAAITVHARLEPEDRARADFYALLARLFTAGPDAGLLAAIAASPALAPSTRTDDDAATAAGLAAAWDQLRAASSVMDVEAGRQEYDDLFVGVGTPPVNLHASHWLTGAMMQKPLVDVRSALATLGLSRRAEATIVEDHLAAMLETMRVLVGGSDARAPASPAEQQAFCEGHLLPWVFDCCNAIEACSLANYYRKVAQLCGFFMALERDSFAIE